MQELIYIKSEIKIYTNHFRILIENYVQRKMLIKFETCTSKLLLINISKSFNLEH